MGKKEEGRWVFTFQNLTISEAKVKAEKSSQMLRSLHWSLTGFFSGHSFICKIQLRRHFPLGLGDLMSLEPLTMKTDTREVLRAAQGWVLVFHRLFSLVGRSSMLNFCQEVRAHHSRSC